MADSAALFFLSQLEALLVTAANVKRETAEDSLMCRAIERVTNGWKDRCDEPDLLPYFRRRDDLGLHDGVLFWGRRVVIQQTLRTKFLAELHNGHPGMVRMKQLARGYLWWPGLESDIELHVSNCEACLNNRSNPPRAEVISWPATDGPWQRVHIDNAPKLNNRVLLIVVDAYSRWLEVGITGSDDVSSSRTIEILRTFFSRYGFPKTIVSDNGPQFSSREFSSFVKSFGGQHQFTAPFSPSTNGQAERAVAL